MLFSTLKFLAKFLKNSIEDTVGAGNFSFFKAFLISISEIRVDFLSIGKTIFVSVLCIINARRTKIVYAARRKSSAAYNTNPIT